MLSLKNTRLQPLTRSKRSLGDLPSEILDLIYQYIYASSGNTISSIFPVSRASRHLRASAYSVIFEQVTIKIDENVVQKSSWDLLQSLAAHPHLIKHVRSLEIQKALEVRHLPKGSDTRSARFGQSISRKRLLECLRLMTGLRWLKISHVSDVVFEILANLEHMNVNSTLISIRWDFSEPYLFTRKGARLEQILASLTNWTFGLSFPSSREVQHSDEMVEWLCNSKVVALDWGTRPPLLQPQSLQKCSLVSLEELHITGRVTSALNRLEMTSVIPWSQLKRLYIAGLREIQQLLTQAVDQLTNLEDLHLHSPSFGAFHDCPNLSNHNSPALPLAYTQLPYLRHLSLRGICTHIHARNLTTPNLRSLTLMHDEYTARIHNIPEARPPSEIKWLAKNLPHLSHLELHTGSLENLWHPTAIPGVEVDVEVYAALQALTQIPNLHTLRLFPPYVPRNAGHDYLNARQPLSDEQAVRLFRHLHALRPSLHTLSVAATFQELRGFSPMSWLVRDGGDSKTILTTRQAGKDYELEQTWLGERRMTMKNKRHGYRKPYLQQFGDDWVFPVEYPFG